MARVTVEDCVVKIPNRFDLVMLAAQRARDITSGAQLSIERDNDKNPVVALREIADETISLETLAESLVQGMQKHVETDEPEEDLLEFDVPSLPGLVTSESEEIAPDALAPDALAPDALAPDALAAETLDEVFETELVTDLETETETEAGQTELEPAEAVDPESDDSA